MTWTLPAAAAEPAAHPVPEEVAGPIPYDVVRSVGRSARPTADGGFNVRMSNGRVVHTHGPDALRGEPGGPFDLLGVPEREPVCADTNHQHLLYGRLASGPDNYAASVPTIISIFKQTNRLLSDAASDATGGATVADYKVKCDGGGDIVVGQFTSPTAAFGDITSAAAAAGFDDPGVDYSIFFDVEPTVACGVGSFYRDEDPGADNPNNNPPGIPGCCTGYAVTYGGPEGDAAGLDCWPTTTHMHENGHNQGAVQAGAPQSTGGPPGGGHCSQDLDVMCYDDDGEPSTFPMTNDCPEFRFDCGYDDYFNPSPAPGSYLDGAWNIGSPLNRFVVYAPAVPTVAFTSASRAVQEHVGVLNLALKRTGDPAVAFDVTLETSPVSAQAADFTDADQVVSFGVGEITKTVPVTVVNDSLKEPAESFIATLSAPTAGAVLGAISSHKVTIYASDQQPDGWLKVSGGSYVGSNRYYPTSQVRSTTAKRGQTKIFYAVIQNDGNYRNTLRVKGVNSSGTSVVYRIGSANVTSTVRSASGRAIALNPGKTVTIRVDFKMGSKASGTEVFTLLTTWTGDRAIKDLVKGYVKVR